MYYFVEITGEAVINHKTENEKAVITFSNLDKEPVILANPDQNHLLNTYFDSFKELIIKDLYKKTGLDLDIKNLGITKFVTKFYQKENI